MEMVLSNGFCEMTNDEFLSIVGGGALLGIPEPTFTTKVAGGALIVTGIGTTLGGVAQIASNI